MKRYWMEGALLLSLGISLFLFYRKPIEDRDDLGRMMKGLQGVKPYLRKSGTIGVLDGLHMPVTEGYVRYALAPLDAEPVQHRSFDTVLVVIPRRTCDTATAAFVTGRTIIWSHGDDSFRYYLVSNP